MSAYPYLEEYINDQNRDAPTTVSRDAFCLLALLVHVVVSWLLWTTTDTAIAFAYAFCPGIYFSFLIAGGIQWWIDRRNRERIGLLVEAHEIRKRLSQAYMSNRLSLHIARPAAMLLDAICLHRKRGIEAVEKRPIDEALGREMEIVHRIDLATEAAVRSAAPFVGPNAGAADGPFRGLITPDTDRAIAALAAGQEEDWSHAVPDPLRGLYRRALDLTLLANRLDASPLASSHAVTEREPLDALLERL
jgi:hypothetical protein